MEILMFYFSGEPPEKIATYDWMLYDSYFVACGQENNPGDICSIQSSEVVMATSSHHQYVKAKSTYTTMDFISCPT